MVSTQPNSSSTPTKFAIAQGRFWLAIGVQGIILAGITLPSLVTYLSGSSVILQTVPVDPYDLLRGYSQTLRYDISDPQYLSTLPGGAFLANTQGVPQKAFYVILQAPDQGSESKPPPAWQAIAVSRDRPQSLSSRQVLLRGELSRNQSIKYGLESYYFPEDQQASMNKQIQAATNTPGSRRQLQVEIRVDRSGRAIPVSLWIGDRNYKF